MTGTVLSSLDVNGEIIKYCKELYCVMVNNLLSCPMEESVRCPSVTWGLCLVNCGLVGRHEIRASCV